MYRYGYDLFAAWRGAVGTRNPISSPHPQRRPLSSRILSSTSSASYEKINAGFFIYHNTEASAGSIRKYRSDTSTASVLIRNFSTTQSACVHSRQQTWPRRSFSSLFFSPLLTRAFGSRGHFLRQLSYPSTGYYPIGSTMLCSGSLVHSINIGPVIDWASFNRTTLIDLHASTQTAADDISSQSFQTSLVGS